VQRSKGRIGFLEDMSACDILGCIRTGKGGQGAKGNRGRVDRKNRKLRSRSGDPSLCSMAIHEGLLGVRKRGRRKIIPFYSFLAMGRVGSLKSAGRIGKGLGGL